MRDVDKVAEQLVGMAKEAVRDFRVEAETEAKEKNDLRSRRARMILEVYTWGLGPPPFSPDSETVQDLITDLAHWLQRQSEEDT